VLNFGLVSSSDSVFTRLGVGGGAMTSVERGFNREK
jgi:hypothetical protein